MIEDLDEALRWCWRHQAELDFYRGEDGDDYMSLTVPTARGGSWSRVVMIRAQELVPQAVLEQVNAARDTLRME